MRTIYTVGHSTHPMSYFMGLLRPLHIQTVCDVRSIPESTRNPQFNRHYLERNLTFGEISYRFFGDSLGGRPDDQSCYDDSGRVDYVLLARTPEWQQGIEQLAQVAKSRDVVIMCSEADPINCHRGLAVARCLHGLNWPVRHIRTDGSLESHSDSLKRLVKRLKLKDAAEDVIPTAYRVQGRSIAYRRPGSSGPTIRELALASAR